MKNPFLYSPFYHYYLVFEHLPRNQRILDYGSGNGEFLKGVSRKTKKLFGFDVDEAKVGDAKKKFSQINYKYLPKGTRLPYKDSFFDVVSMFHVLEHVDSEKRAIAEIYRVLKPGGILYLAAPYNGLFTWADMANLRFRFPRLHKLFFDVFVGNEEYERKFGKNRESGLYGDCSSERSWHTHYKETHIRSLIGSKFSIDKFYKFSFFHPFLLVFINLFNYFLGRVPSAIKHIIWWDNLINAGELSYNFLVIARKK